MIKYIHLFTLILSLLTLNTGNCQSKAETEFTILIDLESALSFMGIDSLKPAVLSADEIQRLTDLAKKHMMDWDKEQPIRYSDRLERPRQLKDYVLQYLPTSNKAGSKLVWINFVYKSDLKEPTNKLFIAADNPRYSNCWVNLKTNKILSR